MYSSLKNSEQILITLGIFAIAAFKLLPTFNSILNSIQKISLGRFSFFKILEQLKNSNLINKDVYIDGQINFNESIELKNVEFSYGDTQIKNLKNKYMYKKRYDPWHLWKEWDWQKYNVKYYCWVIKTIKWRGFGRRN